MFYPTILKILLLSHYIKKNFIVYKFKKFFWFHYIKKFFFHLIISKKCFFFFTIFFFNSYYVNLFFIFVKKKMIFFPTHYIKKTFIFFFSFPYISWLVSSKQKQLSKMKKPTTTRWKWRLYVNLLFSCSEEQIRWVDKKTFCFFFFFAGWGWGKFFSFFFLFSPFFSFFILSHFFLCLCSSFSFSTFQSEVLKTLTKFVHQLPCVSNFVSINSCSLFSRERNANAPGHPWARCNTYRFLNSTANPLVASYWVCWIIEMKRERKRRNIL